jgi:hypothetical protein
MYVLCMELNHSHSFVVTMLEPVKIFDREQVYKHIDYTNGLISVNSTFYNSHDYNVDDIIDTYIFNDKTFEMIMCIASKLLNINKNNMVMWDYYITSWRVHPILMKSILRHIDTITSDKRIIARMIYSSGTIGMDSIRSCSLLIIVDGVEYPKVIKHPYSYYGLKKEYKCDGILNNDDMFNDDVLIYECVKDIVISTLIELITKYLCDIIVSYYNDLDIVQMKKID